jgi:tol-pal system protein YbgF
MTLQRFLEPALVAGFFVLSSAAFAQTEAFRPAAEPAGVLPYRSADTAVNTGTARPLSVAPTDSRAVVIRVQQLEEEIRRLNGLVEEQASLLARLQDQTLERYVEMDRRLAVLGAAEDAVSAVAATGATEGGVVVDPQDGGTDTAQAPVPEAQPGEQEAYQSAYGFVRERQFDQALIAFNAFLAAYPYGRYSPNAHYWLGELYLVVEPVDPESARQNFQLLLDQYPADRKVPDALYKLGRVHALKGNEDRSREYLTRVIDEYGAEQHPAAQLAQDFLDSQL